MTPLIHMPAARLAPGLCLALALAGAMLLPQSLALGCAVVMLAGAMAFLRSPRPEASSRMGANVWTVRYCGEVITLPLAQIAEVRVDHPLNGPDRVHVLMQNGLCLPLPDVALPETTRLVAALRSRGVALRTS